MAVTIQDVVKAYLVMVGVRLLSKPEDFEGLQTIGWYGCADSRSWPYRGYPGWYN